MRPYPTRRLTNKRYIFNYSLSHLQKSAECAFSIIIAKFKVFQGPICCKKETVNSVIKASVLSSTISLEPRKGSFVKKPKTMQ
jgi:hypothetical protein